jgi:hypothetical protein
VVGLVVDDEDFGRGHHQPVDLARHQRRCAVRPLQPSDNRHLGTAAGGKHRGEARIGDQLQHLIDQRIALLSRPILGIAGEIVLRELATAFRCEVRQ